MMALWFVIPAVLNGALAFTVFRLSRRSRAMGTLAFVGVFAIYICAMMFWPGGQTAHSRMEQFGVYGAVVAVTWLPGGALALGGGRGKDYLGVILGVGAVCLATALGAAYPYTAMGIFCGAWGECP